MRCACYISQDGESKMVQHIYVPYGNGQIEPVSAYRASVSGGVTYPELIWSRIPTVGGTDVENFTKGQVTKPKDGNKDYNHAGYVEGDEGYDFTIPYDMWVMASIWTSNLHSSTNDEVARIDYRGANGDARICYTHEHNFDGSKIAIVKASKGDKFSLHQYFHNNTSKFRVAFICDSSFNLWRNGTLQSGNLYDIVWASLGTIKFNHSTTSASAPYGFTFTNPDAT